VLRRPEQADKALWTLALEHVVWLHNRTPQDPSGLTPEELWSGAKAMDDPDQSSLKRHPALLSAKVWGCPAYVLDPKLQDGKKIPKWQPKSRRGMFVGASKLHTNSVGLILNLTTHNISPQFHVVYDNYFTSVNSNDDN
jgi:hypothetical protein